MDLNLSGKVVLVTGSTRGIGLAIARAFVHEGATVVLNGRGTELPPQQAQSLGLDFVAGDVSEAEQARRVIAEILSKYATIDIVVANVGSGVSVPGGTEDSNEWLRMLSLNLLSATQVIEAAKSSLISSQGVVLCISSICGLADLGAPIAYSAAKAALNSYVRGTSALLGPHQVRINGLAPGNVFFPGSTWEKKLQQDQEGVEAMLKTKVPLGRFATPEEIADVAVFLCSSRSSFVTGSIVVVDGGQTRS
ncbi:MAG: SDR family NAD(P)-dependent oxidoreductase [Cyanobacteriota bacterium]